MNPLVTDRSVFNVVIRNGRLIDGTGSAARPADIAIANGRIAEVGSPQLPPDRQGDLEIDATDRVVAPGFIDSHTHDDNAVLINPRMEAKVTQGVTTVIVGNCGISLAPITDIDPPAPHNLLGDRSHYRFQTMKAYLHAVEAARPNVNVAALTGHGTLRLGAMTDLARAATPEETQAMRERLAEAMADGAIGMSSGLFYKPSHAANKQEIVGVVDVLAECGGVYTTHMRDEHEGVLDSIQETVATARKARVPVVISHHKCAGPANFGRSVETLQCIQEARHGTAVGLDAYPYAAGSTVLDPDWVDVEIRILVTTSKPYPEAAGRDLADIAAEWDCSQREAAERLSPAGAVYFQMDEADVRRILAYPPTMIGSDGLPHDQHPHPRLWGTFPRVLGHYCRELGLFSLEMAIHKMTGLTAKTFALRDRGIIREHAHADIVVFDPATVSDNATYEAPTRPSSGIDYVLVNGTVAYADGTVAENGYGQIVQRA